MDDVYENINGYNPSRRRKLLIVFDDMISSGSTALFDIHYINDLNQAIKFSRVHYFADDTNLLLANDSSKKQQG